MNTEHMEEWISFLVLSPKLVLYKKMSGKMYSVFECTYFPNTVESPLLIVITYVLRKTGSVTSKSDPHNIYGCGCYIIINFTA